MSHDILAERQTWFRFFPAGSIEFVVVTRVLALLFLLATGLASKGLMPLVLLALAGVLWMDYVLTLWWAVQMAVDLEDLFREPAAPPGEPRSRAVRAAAIGALPVTLAALILAPWPELAASSEAQRAVLTRVAVPVLGVLFVLSIVVAERFLTVIRFGPRVWSVLFLIPIVHWFALHRLLSSLDARLKEAASRRGQPGTSGEANTVTIALADVTWVLSVLPWAIMLVVSLVRGGWPGGRVMPVCGTLIASVFVVADLAAMEGIQRRFVALVRKL